MIEEKVKVTRVMFVIMNFNVIDGVGFQKCKILFAVGLKLANTYVLKWCQECHISISKITSIIFYLFM